jgi:hypothetical protein
MDKVIILLGGIALFVLISFLLSWPVWQLWNGCLVGAVDGIHEVDWITAWGISLLCGLLFKSNISSSK